MFGELLSVTASFKMHIAHSLENSLSHQSRTIGVNNDIAWTVKFTNRNEITII